MKTVSILLAVLFSISNASALPIHSKITLEDIQTIASHAADSYHYDGIVKLDDCSGALVRFENSNDNDLGMVMSNGHCVAMPMNGFIKPGAIVSHKKVKRNFQFLNDDGSLSKNSVNSTEIVYATMTGTDVSLYLLDMTYAQIKAQYKVNALTIDSQHPTDGDTIDILSGYWQTGYTCTIDGFVYKLHEDAYEWTDSIRYQKDACKTIHGTSGSPILSRNTGKIIGINNTGNDDGEKCTMDNPCEINKDGTIYVEQGRSYGQQTYRFYSCLDSSGKLDVTVAGCTLQH